MKNNVDKIIVRSTKAVCGIMEREVVVRNTEVASTKRKLKSKGYVIIGTGHAGLNSTKIWFNPSGMIL